MGPMGSEEPKVKKEKEGANDKTEEEEEEVSFEELGMEARLIRALAKKGITKPTPIQREAIPLILEGKDVVARAKTGSGKTLAYLLPMLQKLFSNASSKKSAPSSFVLVPTRELCQQVYSEALALLEFCRVTLKVAQVTSSMAESEINTALAGPPDILVSTPACISACVSKGSLQIASIKASLSMMVLDEADLLLSYGYEEDLKTLIPHVPRSCQCLLMSATSSPDVEKLKRLALHNPVTLTLTEAVKSNESLIPNSVQQFVISCDAKDKVLYALALLKLGLVLKKILIFVSSIDMGFRLRLFLEQFGIKSAILNAELPQNSRLHILEEFNVGLFDYLIAIDDCHLKEKEQTGTVHQKHSKNSKKRGKPKLDSEFGVVRGIDFKNVFTVLNFDMPTSPAGYVHRIGRTGRAYNTGTSISLVSPEDTEVLEEIKLMLGEDQKEESEYLVPYPLLNKSAVESLRYRAEDVARSITSISIREARAQDLRNQILNSERLKAHFEDNPKDLDLLKHDKLLSKKAPPPHLREVPEYLLDARTQEASKLISITRSAMGIDTKRRKSIRKTVFGRSGKSRDPLKTFSAEGKKAQIWQEREGHKRRPGR